MCADSPVGSVDTGQTGSFLVGADGVEVTAELGLVQDQSCDDEEQEQPDGADGNDAQNLLADEVLLEPASDLSGCGGPGLSLNGGDDGADILLHLRLVRPEFLLV